MNWNNVDERKVKDISRMFTGKQLAKDTKFVEELIEKTEFNNISELYKVNSNGNNILLDLILDNKMSLAFYINNFKNGMSCFDSAKYELSEKLRRVNESIKFINTIPNY